MQRQAPVMAGRPVHVGIGKLTFGLATGVGLNGRCAKHS